MSILGRSNDRITLLSGYFSFIRLITSEQCQYNHDIFLSHLCTTVQNKCFWCIKNNFVYDVFCFCKFGTSYVRGS